MGCHSVNGIEYHDGTANPGRITRSADQNGRYGGFASIADLRGPLRHHLPDRSATTAGPAPPAGCDMTGIQHANQSRALTSAAAPPGGGT
ncbi:hypothetical protein Jiend_17720 [Micromonospora endophytica]|nr:hypothetical protein Jiend_17720 [Micromonospora endophytica]